MRARAWKVLAILEAAVILGLAAHILSSPRREGGEPLPPPRDTPSPNARAEPAAPPPSDGKGPAARIPEPASPAPGLPPGPWTARESLVDRGAEAWSAWRDLARSDPEGAIRAAREFLDGSSGPDFDWMQAKTALARLVSLGTPEALALVLEYMEKSDGEFDFSHRSESFFEALSGAPRAFAPQIERAAIRKVTQLIREENLSWNTVYGYAKLAGRFSTGDGERFLKDAYEGKLGSDPSLATGAFQGLCHTGNPAMIDYLLDSESLLILSEDECRCLALLGREKLVERMKERLLRGTAADDSPVRKHWNFVCSELVGRFGGSEAVPLFELLWRRGDDQSRVHAIVGLRSVGPVGDPAIRSQARDLVFLGLQDPEEGIRRTAAYALEYNENYACEESLRFLRGRLAIESDMDVRRGIFDAIRRMEKTLKRRRPG